MCPEFKSRCPKHIYSKHVTCWRFRSSWKSGRVEEYMTLINVHARTSPCRGAFAGLAVLPYLWSSSRRSGLTDHKYPHCCQCFASCWTVIPDGFRIHGRTYIIYNIYIRGPMPVSFCNVFFRLGFCFFWTLGFSGVSLASLDSRLLWIQINLSYLSIYPSSYLILSNPISSDLYIWPYLFFSSNPARLILFS